MKVKCTSCQLEVEKPQIEFIFHFFKKLGGNLKENICPKCKDRSLKWIRK